MSLASEHEPFCPRLLQVPPCSSYLLSDPGRSGLILFPVSQEGITVHEDTPS